MTYFVKVAGKIICSCFYESDATYIAEALEKRGAKGVTIVGGGGGSRGGWYEKMSGRRVNY